MLIFVMRHLMQYHSVCPLLFENYKKWLECNMITVGALTEYILSEAFHGHAGAVSQYLTLAGRITLATLKIVSRISSRSHF